MGSSASIAEKDQQQIILFDGVCNLCNSSVQFIIKRDPLKKFTFASLQSPAATKLLMDFKPQPQDVYSILLIKNGRLFDRSDAILEIVKDLNGGWTILRLFRFLPKTFRDFFYKLISSNRYKLFGKQDSCLVPTADLRGRFLNES
jgi:predicted DCC family thiol-disulfide oxidoreductase YuxK